MGPGSVSQHSSHVDGQLASAYNSPILYIYPAMTLRKPVYSEPLSVTVPVAIGTCMVLVGTVDSALSNRVILVLCYDPCGWCQPHEKNGTTHP